MAKIKAIKLTDLTKDNVKKLISSFDIDLRSKLDEEKRILITELRRKNKRRLENNETDPDTINPKVKDKLILTKRQNWFTIAAKMSKKNLLPFLKSLCKRNNYRTIRYDGFNKN